MKQQTNLLKKAEKLQREAESTPAPQQAAKNSNANRLTYKEKKELEALETEIEQLEAEKKILLEQMNGGETDGQKIVEIGRRYQVVADSIDEKSMRWLELSEKE